MKCFPFCIKKCFPLLCIYKSVLSFFSFFALKSVFFLFIFKVFILCAWVLCMFACAPWVCSTHRSQKRASDFLELELQRVVSCHVGAFSGRSVSALKGIAISPALHFKTCFLLRKKKSLKKQTWAAGESSVAAWDAGSSTPTESPVSAQILELGV